MLHAETKRKIDNARDTLVGKIPVPMSQIEQITLAMIYKFMSDIDLENRELGGSSFFEGDFEKYAWQNLMDKRLGAQERMNLYSEGLDSMTKNKNIPELFRDIFRNAYLPFKDPQTLDRFLKQINEFSYDHSEELGNAFEYLLSTAGSQGDAGQFRTPRHIIDFLVSIVEPTVEDTILDPACGTAGFLISAYKYILAQNTTPLNETQNPLNSPLSGGESYNVNGASPSLDKGRLGGVSRLDLIKKLSKNINGYDISHDMVRLSLVNMYLHNFANPKIFEYDTLSSEDRWNDDFDCILANPPFMTPKGGIQPHSKFSIKASKSEVLFVDYIMEHLSINGKAGIIIPEGIIFQSANAYKELRKNMIENNFLWAVVSLPSGIFQPYSGVKTSILLFDKNIAKKTDKILFVKVEQDGFGLGAQRREIQKNDLPSALELLLEYKKSVLEDKVFENTDKNVLVVDNEKIKLSGDYNLSAERYRENKSLQNSDFEMVELGEVCKTTQGIQIPLSETIDERIIGYKRYIYISDLINDNHLKYVKDIYLEKEVSKKDLIMVNTGNTSGKIYWGKEGILSNNVFKITTDNNILNKKFLYYFLNCELFQNRLKNYFKQGAQPHLGHKLFAEQKIPLPPLEIQEQIVAELDNYQKIIDGAKLVVENYKPRIKIDDSWEVVELKNITEKITDGTHSTPNYTDSGIPFLRVTDITESNDTKKFISKEEHKELIKRCKPEKGDILYTKNGTIGIAKIIDWDYEFSIFVSLCLIKPKNELILSKYLEIFMNSENCLKQSLSHSKQGAITNLHLIEIKQFKIPLPPLEIQEKIVAKIEEEQKLVESSKKLIEIFEGKIKERISEVWGEGSLDSNI